MNTEARPRVRPMPPPDLEVLVDASVKLVDPGRDETDCVEFSCFFAATPHKARLASVALFRDWLLAEAAATRTTLFGLRSPHLAAVPIPAVAAE